MTPKDFQELKNYVDDFQRLKESKGWQRVAIHLKTEMEGAFRSMTSPASAGDQVLRATAAYCTMKSLLSWVDQNLDLNLHALREAEKEAMRKL